MSTSAGCHRRKAGQMYPWLIFAHVLGVFGFLLAHGASAAVAFKLRRERSLERVRALLELSQGSTVMMSGSLVVVLATGVAAGFLGNWWGQYWIWTSLGVFVLIGLSMNLVGRRSFERVRTAVALEHSRHLSPSTLVTKEEDLRTILRSVHPLLLTLIGGVGLAALLWLMMFKPF
jgi:hypothetical protein